MTPRRQRLIALIVSIAAALAACGVSSDGDPRVIAADDVPFSLLESDISTSSTDPSGVNTQPATLYLIRSGEDGTELAAVTREVAKSPTPADIISTLLDLKPDEDDPNESGLISNIPDSTILLGAVLDESLLVLNFNENLLTVIGDAQAGLFAQIVCTATEIEGVDRVSFRIDNEPKSVVVDGGVLESDPVDCSDYRSFTPTIGPEN